MFSPVICDYYSGMVVSVPIQTRMLDKKVTARQVHEMYEKHYAGAKMIEVMPLMSAEEQKSFFLASNTLSGRTNCRSSFSAATSRYSSAHVLTISEREQAALLFSASI